MQRSILGLVIGAIGGYLFWRFNLDAQAGLGHCVGVGAAIGLIVFWISALRPGDHWLEWVLELVFWKWR